MTVVDQRLHEAEQQREQQGGDVLAVDVGVGHQHDLVVPELGDVEVVVHAGAERADDRLDLGVLQDLVDPRLLDVEDLAAQREDRLRARVAAVLGRAAGGVALDDEQLALLGVTAGAVGQLAGETATAQEALAVAGEVAGLARGESGGGGVDGLADDDLALGRIALEPGGELVVDDLLHEAARLGVAELRLRLALELRLRELDGDDRGEALADVLARQLLLALEQVVGVGEPLDGRGERGAEALLVGAALVRVDRVRERVHRLAEGVVPLHRQLEGEAVLLVVALDGDDVAVDGRAGAHVDVVHVVDESAVVAEAHLALEVVGTVLVVAAEVALVAQVDLQALVEEGHLAEAALEGVEGVVGRLEDVGVGVERLGRAGLVGRLALLELAGGHTVVERLAPDEAVALDDGVHRGAQRVDHGDADTVQTAGDLVAAATELAARVQRRHDEGDGRDLLGRVHVDGDAATVVDHAHAAVVLQHDLDVGGVARERLVDGVVDDLVDEVVQTALTRGADVHAGTLADGLETLEHLDVARVVRALDLGAGDQLLRDGLGRGLVVRRGGHCSSIRAIVWLPAHLPSCHRGLGGSRVVLSGLAAPPGAPRGVGTHAPIAPEGSSGV